MGFFDKVKKAFGSEKEDIESHNNDELAEDKEKEIRPIDSEESVLKDKEMDEREVIGNFRYLDELIHSGKNEIVLVLNITLQNIRFKHLIFFSLLVI